MIVIASGRKTSRTTQLIEMSAEAEANGLVNYIVVGTHDQAYRVAGKAKEMGLSIGFPLTFAEWYKGEYHGKVIDHFLIDNADHLLQWMCPVPIKAIVVQKDAIND